MQQTPNKTHFWRDALRRVGNFAAMERGLSWAWDLVRRSGARRPTGHFEAEGAGWVAGFVGSA